MARSVAASAIISRARELADQETSTPSTAFVDDTEALAWLNNSVGIWHGMLVKAVPERFETSENLTITGAASYALPATHYLTLGVDYQLGSTSWYPLNRIQYQERTRFETTGDIAEGYYLRGATLVLLPAPSSGTYRHSYITAAPVLLAATEVDGANGWESWLVYDLAIKMMSKEESDPSALLAKQAEIKAEMDAAAADREASTPMRIVDTRLNRY
jgi:hypothetical protein